MSLAQRNGRHKPAPTRLMAYPYRSKTGVDYGIELWSLPGLGRRWYASRAGRYLDRDGFIRPTVDDATPFAGDQDCRHAIDEHEVETRALYATERPGVPHASSGCLAVKGPAPPPEPVQTPTSLVFVCRGNRYTLLDLTSEGGAGWLVRLDGRPVILTERGGEVCFGGPAEAQQAAERHAMIGHREASASYLEAMAGLVRKDAGAVVLIDSGDEPGETVIRIRGLAAPDQSVT